MSCRGFPRWHSGKESASQCKRCVFNPWVGMIPLRRKWQPTPIFFPGPRVHPNPCASSRWCHPTISSSVDPFSSYRQSFPVSGSFPASQLFVSSGQNIGTSASVSVLSMNTQGWIPLGLTSLISLQSKWLSSLFQHHSINSLVLRFLYSPILTSIHDYWKSSLRRKLWQS